jgi:hypothetical protein
MLVGLVLGLILQPILASIGELHEITHEAASAHHALSSDVAEGDAGDAETLHQVHQFAHCCGHVVMAPSAPMAVAQIGHDEPRALADPPQVPSRQSLAPFRPPNTA